MPNGHEIVLSSQNDAQLILDAMKDLLSKHNYVTFADLLELAGLTSVYHDTTIGWTDLTNIEVKSINRCFVLDLPPTKEV